MDKVKRYRDLIKKTLQNQNELLYQSADDSAPTHTIFDENQDRYMLYRTGWWGQKRVSTPVVYVHLKNNKIWIEEDWTEDGITPCLLEKGVPHEDIVLAFRHPSLRPLTDFAVA